MSFRLWHAVVFVVALVVFAAARAPAAFFAPQRPGAFTYDGVQGTIWNAQFNNVLLAGYPVRVVSWRLSLADLLQGKLAADVSLVDGAIQGDVRLLANWRGDRRILAPRLDIEGASLSPGLTLAGATQVRDLDIVFLNGKCSEASGALNSDVLTSNAQVLGWAGPPLTGAAGCRGDDGIVALVGERDGESARAEIAFRGNGDAEWRVDVATATQTVEAALIGAGFARDPGQAALAAKGTMRWAPF